MHLKIKISLLKIITKGIIEIREGITLIINREIIGDHNSRIKRIIDQEFRIRNKVIIKFSNNNNIWGKGKWTRMLIKQIKRKII